MTSFGGLIVFQQLFSRLGLWRKLEDCGGHLQGSHLYSHRLCLRMILLHLLLRFSRLRDVDYYGE